MKKVILLLLTNFLLMNIVSAYNIVQNVSFQRDKIVITKKSLVTNYIFTVKTSDFSGNLTVPFSVSWTNLTYCRNIYNITCNLILTGTTTTGQTVIDTISVNFDLYSGVWLKPLSKTLQPCYASVVIKSFKPEGTVNYALPGDSLVLDIVAGGSLDNVFFNLFIKEANTGVIVTNSALAPRQYPISVLGASFKKTFFGLNDTLVSGRAYEVSAFVNCGNLPNVTGIFTQMDISVFRKFPGSMWNLNSCTPSDVVLLQQPPLELVVDSIENDSFVEQDTLSRILIFPNPTEGEIALSLDGNEITLPVNYTLQLFNYHGTEIFLDKENRLAENLVNGIYLLKINNGNGKSRFLKIIKTDDGKAFY